MPWLDSISERSLEGSIITDCRWPKINNYLRCSGGMYPCNQHAPNIAQEFHVLISGRWWFGINIYKPKIILATNCASGTHHSPCMCSYQTDKLSNPKSPLICYPKLMHVHSIQLNHASLWSGVSHQIHHNKPLPHVRWLSSVPLHPCMTYELVWFEF